MKKYMRGFIDPISLGFILALTGATTAYVVESGNKSAADANQVATASTVSEVQVKTKVD